MTKTKLTTFAASTAIAMLLAVVAFATVTFYPNGDDPTSGTGNNYHPYGFVGKGDLQIPWGWNNQKLQAEAGNISFDYVVTDTYDVTCEWDTPTHHGTVHHSISVPKHTGILDSVDYDARTHKQVDGFNLTGASGTTSGTVPVVGGACLGEGVDDAVITAVTLVSSVSELTASDVSAGTGPTHIWP